MQNARGICHFSVILQSINNISRHRSLDLHETWCVGLCIIMLLDLSDITQLCSPDGANSIRTCDRVRMGRVSTFLVFQLVSGYRSNDVWLKRCFRFYVNCVYDGKQRSRVCPSVGPSNIFCSNAASVGLRFVPLYRGPIQFPIVMCTM